MSTGHESTCTRESKTLHATHELMLTHKYGESKISFSEIGRSLYLTIGTSVAGHRTASIIRVVFLDYCIE
jgi:hypothetical protein